MLKPVLQSRILIDKLYPLFVLLPVGLWITSLGLDLSVFGTGNPTLAPMSHYFILLGIIGALLRATVDAAVEDLAADTQAVEPSGIKRFMTRQNFLRAIALALYAANFFLRRDKLMEGVQSVSGLQILLSILSLAILAVASSLDSVPTYKRSVERRAA